MLSLEEKINSDYLVAYKSKDEDKISVLRLLRSIIKNTTIDKKGELNDEEIQKLIRREVKQRQEAVVEYEKGQRLDLVQKENREIAILKEYLPEELDEHTIRNIIIETIKELGATSASQTGAVIGAVMAKTKARAAGNTVAKIVQEILNSDK